MNRRLAYFFALAACLTVLWACSDSDIEDGLDSATKWSVTIQDGDALSAASHYNSIVAAVSGERPQGQIRVSTDADWLTIDTDTLPADGVFDVLPAGNLNGESRSAQIVFTSTTDGTVCRANVVQSAFDAENYDPTIPYHIGYGYSVFDEYKNTNSFRGSVISLAKLQALDNDTSFVSRQESVRGFVDYEYYSAYSLKELQRKFSEASTSISNFLVYSKTIKRFMQISTNETNENYYAYARMTRSVAVSSIDVGAVKYVFSRKDLVESRQLPFTDEFYEYYDAINSASGDRTELIKKMIERFGTHVIASAKLGGSLELLTTYDRDSVTNLDETTEEVFKHILGSNTSADAVERVKSMSSSFASKASFNVIGGTEEARNALEDNIKNLSAQGNTTLSSDLLSAWQSGITYTALYDDDQRKNLGEVDFTYIPIWDLFADHSVRKEILSVVMALAELDKNDLDRHALGVDNYAIPLIRTVKGRRWSWKSWETDYEEYTYTVDDTKFDDKPTTSLVRVLCRKNTSEPVAEICSEYVPKVRSDKRITVIYPIVNGMTRITMGLFPGDGENRPAFLSFAKGDVYVKPLSGYKYTDRLDTIYYIHGMLSDTNQGIKLSTGSNFVTKDHKMRFSDSSVSYPVVKIGSGYWTRSDIKDYMAWGYYSNGYFRAAEWRGNDYSYALVKYTNAPVFLSANSKIYGIRGNSDGKRTRWYVPRVEDKDNLVNYVGRNLKSLLAGQQSGFEANFLGRYADHDPQTGDKYETPRRFDEGKRCYIVFKDVTTNNNIDLVSRASVLAFKPDYTLETVPSAEVSLYYYPVRLFRTNYYNYIQQGVQQ